MKPNTSNGVTKISLAVKAVTALHQAPSRALCPRNLTPASHDRMHAAKAVTALRLPSYSGGPAARAEAQRIRVLMTRFERPHSVAKCLARFTTRLLKGAGGKGRNPS